MKTATRNSRPAKKSRRHQKLTLGRTKLSRRARRIRRTFLDVSLELEIARGEQLDAATIAKLSAKVERAREAFEALPKLAQPLEVSRRAAIAALKAETDGEDEGEEDE